MNLLDLYLKENHGVPHESLETGTVHKYEPDNGFMYFEDEEWQVNGIEATEAAKVLINPAPYRKPYTFTEAANDNEHTYECVDYNEGCRFMVKTKSGNIGVYWTNETDYPNGPTIEQINGKWYRVGDSNV